MSEARRLLIVNDGEAWFVRRLATSVEHMDDEFGGSMEYRCDQPIGGRLPSLDDAVRVAKTALNDPQSSVWK